ncbi:uncharacterized protein LOC124935270 [Impatiens glandulifera]|uniref:uncharacterized protein LOC124935270 n=1 Tax=Impatiens glandulifera TaxID=253017 RepID=UPI001FB119A1|nr:uncharacterized protein LOC124935270 [Impatiens glandulifera]
MTSNMSMKLIFHKERNKVLYAEVGKDVLNFLFYILTVLVTTITKIFSNYKKGMVGCLFNFYKCFENLNNIYIQPDKKKDEILNPSPSFLQECLLLPNPIQTGTYVNVNLYKCSDCENAKYSGENEPGLVAYFVMDDLEIKPMSTISSISLLSQFNVKDVGDLQEMVVVLGINEGFKILEASIKGKEVLTSLCQIGDESPHYSKRYNIFLMDPLSYFMLLGLRILRMTATLDGSGRFHACGL